MKLITKQIERNALGHFKYFDFKMGAAGALVLGVHSTRGTPEPLSSTIPTIILSPISFAIWGVRKRKQLGMASGNDPHDTPVQNKKPIDLP